MKPETSRQKQAEATRKRVFLCAQELFTERAYENVTIRHICREAGVAIGTFYHYFPNKESILNEGYRQFDQELEAMWRRYVPASHVDAIHFLIRGQLDAITRKGVIGAAQFFKHQLSNEVKYILDKDRFFYRTLLEQVEAECAAGRLVGAPGEIADEILRGSRGMIYDWCLHEGSYDIFEAGDKAVDMVLGYHGRR